jgi:DNA primase
MASNAKPLWMQLPEGALKIQMLGEIADLVQLSSRELSELWLPKTSQDNTDRSKRSQNSSWSSNLDGSYKSSSFKKTFTRPRAGGRTLPASRADHATRILLSDMAALEALSAEDHSMLCELPAPHGPLFTWLESQFHEHGPQPWVALREGLREHEGEDLAVRLMSGYEFGSPDEEDDSASELRNLLNRMLVDRLIFLETDALQAAKADPTALLRYKEFYNRRRAIQSSFSTSET